MLSDLERRYIIAKHRALRLTDRELTKLGDEELLDLEMVKDSDGQPLSSPQFEAALARIEGHPASADVVTPESVKREQEVGGGIVCEGGGRQKVTPMRPPVQAVTITAEQDADPFTRMRAVVGNMVAQHYVPVRQA